MRFEKAFTADALAKSGDFTAVHIEDADRCVEGSFATDLLSHAIGNAKSGDAWLTVLTNPNIIAPASIADVACLVICDNIEPTELLINKCETMGISLFKTELPVTDAAVKLYLLGKE